jgi:hypothetical protein
MDTDKTDDIAEWLDSLSLVDGSDVETDNNLISTYLPTEEELVEEILLSEGVYSK